MNTSEDDKVWKGVTRDEDKVDPITDRLQALGVEAAHSNIAWWKRRLVVYERWPDTVNDFLVVSARQQIAVQQAWLARQE